MVGPLLETLREPDRMRAALARAAGQGVAVVALTVGGSTTGRTLVAAHSGALAGADGAWEALFDAYGVIRVADLDEMADTLELLAGRPAGAAGAGGSPRSTTPVPSGRWWRTWPTRWASPSPASAPSTRRRLAALLDPGLVPANPLDVWGTGRDTEGLFAGCLRAMADDEDVSAVALAVDLVEEYDGDESYPDAVIGAAADHRQTGRGPVQPGSAIDARGGRPGTGRRSARSRGHPERAVGSRHLLEHRAREPRPPPVTPSTSPAGSGGCPDWRPDR